MEKGIKKGRKVKCKNCESMVFKSECYVHEHLDKNFNIKNIYYCNEKCCENKEKEKELVNECNELFDEILEIPARSNMYFNKLYKEIRDNYNIKAVYEFLRSEQSYLEKVLYKDFVSNNAKIKYFFAILQDKINNYKDIVENRERNDNKVIKEVEFEFDEDEFIPKENIKQVKKRSIEDILNSL